ncbi:uncharacterized protein MELLADRAFT_64355 [Melampsora larici-populina 98AG31]|uniref:Uncharacterized protein n=1 Tax=Melampsora larici-populina (strain 98AG31 / pathotype 3-4-7) TaxID=747676 RepID=F4RR52_MELLP|nr:uncharacterized protein MELLADRAFT_64355 [Melampsora larici-populina 98AG31]EGG05155.1 hypothetical protein MELLADRAFT_64355 [Melampsora larici-populina 98AG31]
MANPLPLAGPGNAIITYNCGKTYDVHLFGLNAHRIVRPAEGEPFCLLTRIEYPSADAEYNSTFCTIYSNTPDDNGRVRDYNVIARVVSEAPITKASVDRFLARVQECHIEL